MTTEENRYLRDKAYCSFCDKDAKFCKCRDTRSWKLYYDDIKELAEECYMKCTCVSYLESELKSIIKKDGFYIHQLTHERTKVIPVNSLKQLIKKLNK